jgi:hypothetical protein
MSRARVCLPVQGGERFHLLVHAAQDDDADDAHREQEDSDQQEAREQLRMDRRPDLGDSDRRRDG